MIFLFYIIYFRIRKGKAQKRQGSVTLSLVGCTLESSCKVLFLYDAFNFVELTVKETQLLR